MRFVWAVVAFVLAAGFIGTGIAQRTLFLGPSEETQELAVDDPQPYLLIDGDVLRAHPGLQTFQVRGEGEIFAAYGRDADVKAWLSDATYTHVSLGKDDSPKTKTVDPVVEPTEDSGRNPAGSDLWLDSYSDEDALIVEAQLPEGMSMIVSRDGTEPAPADLVVSWPLDTSTPWAGPLIVIGGIFLVGGVVLYILAIRFHRHGGGPRRKGSRAPAPAGRTENGGSGSSSAAPGAAQRTALAGRRRLALVVPMLAVTAVVATGCTSEIWPEFNASPSATPTPDATETLPADQKAPAVTEAQAERILQRISTTVEKADKDMSAKQLESAMTGPALSARKTDYTLRKKVDDRDAPAAIPTDEVEVLLPQAFDEWPRTVMMLTKSGEDDSVPPVIFTMTQDDPWSNYRISHIAEMQASSELPDLAPAWLGATLVPPDSTFLEIAPAELGEAFASLVDDGDKSEFSGMFDESSQKVAASIVKSRKAVVKGLKDKGAAKTSKASFGMEQRKDDPISLATLDSGAVVSVTVADTETIKPTDDDAVIKFGDNPEVSTLTGKKDSAKGVETTYLVQLFFAVPAQGSSDQIRLLAMRQDILDAEVLK